MQSRPRLSSGIATATGLLVACLLVSFLGVHDSEAVSILGRVTLLVGSAGFGGLALGLIAVSPVTTKHLAVVCSLLLSLLGLYMATALAQDPIQAAGRVTQLFIVVSVIYVTARVAAEGGTQRVLAIGASVASLVLLILAAGAVTAGFGQSWAAGLRNPNALGMTAFMLLFFVLANAYYMRPIRALPLAALPFMLSLVIVVSSGSRASFLSLIVASIVYMGWRVVVRSRLRYWSLFWGVLFICGLATAIISQVLPVAWLEVVDAMSREYFGKRLFSGREDIWIFALEAIAERPFLGWGAGIRLSDIAEWHLSVHNFYLQVALQVGLVGLILVIASFAIVWRVMWSARNHGVIRVTGAYIAGTLILQTFEVTLTQNNLAFGLPFWSLTGLAVGIVYRDRMSGLNLSRPSAGGCQEVARA